MSHFFNDHHKGGVKMLLGRPARFLGRPLTWLTIVFCLALVMTVAPYQPALAQTKLTVNTIEDELNVDGDCSLREAIQAANTDGAVDACPAGSDADTINFDNLLSGQIINLTLFDTGVDSTEFGPTAFDIVSTITIVGPTPNGITLARGGTPNFRLFRVTSSGNLSLRNVTLRNGVAKGGHGTLDWCFPDCGGAGGGGGAGMGGAIFNEGTVTIENSTLEANQAVGGGGGVGGDGGSGNGGGGVGESGKTVYDATNQSYGGGPNGGIGNTATPTNGGNGGGGGGSGDFAGNGGNGGFGGGGGGASGAGMLGGNGGFGGGGGGNRSATGTTGLGGFGGGNSCNSAAGGGAGMGGAIFNRAGTVVMINATLSNNSANGASSTGCAFAGHGLGGAIFNLDGGVTAQFSTLSNNRVDSSGNGQRADGGAIFIKQLDGKARLTLNNSILANTESGQTDLFNDGGTVGGSQTNIVETNAANENGAPASLLILNNGDPNLDALADNGGPSFTHAPLPGSRAIDAADAATCSSPAVNNLDQRNFVRPVDGNDDNIAACDIGSLEFRAAAPSTAHPDLTISKSHTGDFTQGQTGAQYTILVTNNGTGPTSGTVTVVDTLPAGLTATALGGTGWNCTLGTLTCTRSDALAASSSYEPIILTVNVGSDAPASVTNSATVAGGGEQNTGNNTTTDPTTVNLAPPTPVLLLSANENGKIAGLSYRDEDIIAYSNGVWSMLFDGSNVGLGNTDIDDFAILPTGEIVLSVEKDFTLNGFGPVGNEDILKFTPTALGAATAGSWSLYFDGSDVGLEANNDNEDIKAIDFDGAGRLVISVRGKFDALGVKGDDKDLFTFTGTTGLNTSGSWAVRFDGSDLKLKTDLRSVWLDNNAAVPELYLTVEDNFSVTANAPTPPHVTVQGDANDIFICQQTGLGSNTICAVRFHLDGGGLSLGQNGIDGLSMGKLPTVQTTPPVTAAVSVDDTVIFDGDDAAATPDPDEEQAAGYELFLSVMQR